jgi:threonine/homoserine/homoserine lactone efflux protein
MYCDDSCTNDWLAALGIVLIAAFVLYVVVMWVSVLVYLVLQKRINRSRYKRVLHTLFGVWLGVLSVPIWFVVITGLIP